MRRAVRSELLRLRRRSFALGLLLMSVFALMGTALAFTSAADLAATDVAPPGGSQVTVADLEASDGFAAGLHAVSSLVGIVALSCCAVATTGDVSSGLLRLLVQAEPRRWRLVAAKTVALILWTCVGTSLATAVAVLAAPAVAGSADVSTDAWGDEPVAALAASWAHLTLSTLAWGALGLVIASVVRSAVAAVAGGVAYVLVVENLVQLFADRDLPYLPGRVLAALARGGSEDVAVAVAGLAAVAAVVVATALAALRLTRSDVVQ